MYNLCYNIQLLSILDFRAFEDILRWQPHGKSFVVLNPEALVEQTLKPYFGMNKLRAFERKVRDSHLVVSHLTNNSNE